MIFEYINLRSELLGDTVIRSDPVEDFLSTRALAT